MHVEVSVANMQVVFSIVHYAHSYFYRNYASDQFQLYICDSFKQQLYIPFSNGYPFFIKLNIKHEKAPIIISNLHFTTLLNTLPKLRYFVGRIYITAGYIIFIKFIYKSVRRFIQYFCFPNRPIKGEDILDFQKGSNVRKGGLAQKRGV